MRELLARIVAAALLAPVAICAAQLVVDLHGEAFARVPRGAGRMDVAVDAGPGREFTFEAPGAAGAEGMLLAAATYATRPRASIDVCVRERCGEHVVSLRDGELLPLPLPEVARGDQVRVRVNGVRGGRLAFWGGPGEPGVTWLRRGAWGDRLARASAYARAFGVRWLPAELAGEAAVLLFVALCSLVAAVRLRNRSRPAKVPARESDRADPSARTAS
jgi:hypothetical protein